MFSAMSGSLYTPYLTYLEKYNTTQFIGYKKRGDELSQQEVHYNVFQTEYSTIHTTQQEAGLEGTPRITCTIQRNAVSARTAEHN